VIQFFEKRGRNELLSVCNYNCIVLFCQGKIGKMTENSSCGWLDRSNLDDPPNRSQEKIPPGVD
jgi:hypothetical protein